MHTHVEHRWTIHPTRDGRVAIEGWQDRRGPTRGTTAARWVAEGHGLGLLLRGLTAVRPITPTAERLASRVLPPTSCSWDDWLLYQGPSEIVPHCGTVELLSGDARQVGLPTEPVGKPTAATDLASCVLELQLASIIAAKPDLTPLALAAIGDRRPIATLSEIVGATPSDDLDPWRSLRIADPPSAALLNALTSTALWGPRVEHPRARLSRHMAAAAQALKLRDLTCGGMAHRYPPLPEVEALRSLLRDLTSTLPGDPLDGRQIAHALRKHGARVSRRSAEGNRWTCG